MMEVVIVISLIEVLGHTTNITPWTGKCERVQAFIALYFLTVDTVRPAAWSSSCRHASPIIMGYNLKL